MKGKLAVNLEREHMERETQKERATRGYSKLGSLNYPCMVLLSVDMDVSGDILTGDGKRLLQRRIWF